MLDFTVQLAAAFAAASVMGIAWAASLTLRDASVADIAWGPCLATIAWVVLGVGDGDDGRELLLAFLITIWALRLATHIAWRHDGEDRRYAAMRERHGESFPRRSLWSVFGIQAAIAWVISLPVQVAAADQTPGDFGAFAWVGLAVFTAGLAIESFADAQLERFKRSPTNEGAVLGSGLWRYSRHPNYFGETCVWWGIWLIALETGSAIWTVISPILLTILLLRVSGVALTERTISSRRPGYDDYVERTSAFVPLPPKRPPRN